MSNDLQTINAYCELEKTSLTFKREVTKEEWSKVFSGLKTIEGCVQFWIGDCLKYREQKWGMYKDVVEESGYSQGTIENIKSICDSVESPRRRGDLSFGHHAEVASLEASSQDKFLQQAVDNEWSIKDLRSAIKSEENINKLIENKYEVKLSLYGENIYFNSSSCIEDRWDDHIIEEDKFPCLTRLGRFFHENGLEFSLREYARVQDFPDDYKFVGTYSDIKSQIGNAVSPKMASYIGKKLKGITVVDLFAGCGGMSLGLENIGKEILFANEYEIKYFQTYIANHLKTDCCLQNILELHEDNIPDVDIVVGGPPCQGFSSAGLRIKDDPRNKLYKEFLRVVDIKKPKEFLMENVSQIEEIKDSIISDFKDIGYTTEFEIVQGLDIGMKQSRKRAFFIGKIK